LDQLDFSVQEPVLAPTKVIFVFVGQMIPKLDQTLDNPGGITHHRVASLFLRGVQGIDDVSLDFSNRVR